MKILTALVLGLYLLFQSVPEISAAGAAPQVLVPPVVKDVNPQESFQPEAFRSGRGSFRSGRSGYTGGTRSGVTPGINNPVNRSPAASTGRFGGFFGGLFGGMLAGTLLGSLLNPFSFGGMGGGGLSLISILFWGVVIYLIYRLLRNLFGRSRKF
jgi:predicted lipid-binding transport protein (Tim44 family)